MKSMNGLAELALQVPDKIIHLLKIMEREAKPTPGSFKPVDAFCHPEDYRKLVDKFLAEEKRTVDLLRKHCDQILKNRYWRWILMHPGLGEDRIHPSRSMLLNPYPNVFKNNPFFICVSYATRLLFLSQRTWERSGRSPQH